MSQELHDLLTVRGREYTVRIDRGIFTVDIGARRIRAASWDELEKRAATEASRQRVAVDVDFMTTNGRKGTITGVHAGHGGALVRWEETGKRETINDSSTALRADTDVAELHRLVRENQATHKALEGFLSEHRMGTIRIVAENAVRAALDAEAVPSDD